MSTINKREIVCNGHIFESISEFCKEYGLKYSSVTHHLHQGRSPEYILEALSGLPASDRYSEDSRIGYKVEYNGARYPSIVSACDSLGLSPTVVYTYKKMHGCSASQAIKKVFENDGDDPARRPVKVDGILYPSKAAACAAYGVPYITVISWAKRNGTSFEEALANGGFSRKHRKAEELCFKQVLGGLTEQDPDADDQCWVKLKRMLEDNAYETHSYYNKEAKKAVLTFATSLHLDQQKRDIYIILPSPRDSATVNIEMVMPKVLQVDTKGGADMTAILTCVNEVNLKFGVQCCLDGDQIRTNMMVYASQSNLHKRVIYIALHRFIGTSARIQTFLAEKLGIDTRSI